MLTMKRLALLALPLLAACAPAVSTSTKTTTMKTPTAREVFDQVAKDFHTERTGVTNPPVQAGRVTTTTTTTTTTNKEANKAPVVTESFVMENVTNPAADEWRTLEAASPTPVRTFNRAPEMKLLPNHDYRAVFVTSKGNITVELFADKAPNTVNNFVHLATHRFYDATRFHRVIDGFMAQGGDPQSAEERLQNRWGTGGPGYSFADEFVPALKHDAAGVLSMANSGPATNGSQFFITYGPTPHLDGKHTVFGRVIDGLENASALNRTEGPKAAAPDFLNRVEIQVRPRGAQR